MARKAAAPTGTRVGFYVDAAGEHRWQVIATNGRIVADCAEGYTSRAMAEKGLDAAYRAITIWYEKAN